MATFQEFEQTMERVFPGRNAHQVNKCASMFTLATYAPNNGNIIELGAYQGMGAAALCLGAERSVRVHTVDDYVARKSYTGKNYDYGNYAYFKRNTESAGVEPVLIKGTTVYAKEVLSDILLNLVFFDLGEVAVIDEFERWHRNVVKGGYFAVHDTARGELGVVELERKILMGDYPGWSFLESLPADITVFVYEP